MLRFAWIAMTSFSTLPLRASFYAGFGIAAFGMSWVAYSVMRDFVYGDNLRGWTSQMVVTCLIGAAVLISNAILGAYIGQIFEEIKGRPLYIVSGSVNLASVSATASTLLPVDQPVVPFTMASPRVLSQSDDRIEAA